MIDWLTCGIYLDVDGPARSVPCDVLAVLKPDGDVSLVRDIKYPVPGSYDDKVYIWRTSLPRPGFKGLRPGLVVSGNPPKFFQGHNVFGSDDCEQLALWMCARVLTKLDFRLTEFELALFNQGFIRLSRVDCTAMLDYGTDEEARRVSHHLGRVGSLPGKRSDGRATMHGDTTYFRERSRYWQFKTYPKGPEIRKKGHELSEKLSKEDRDRLTEYAAGALRLELELKTPELERRGLSMAGSWTVETGRGELLKALEGVRMPQNVRIGELAIEGLPKELQRCYALWCANEDVGRLYPRTTLWRYRKVLLGLGVDILRPPYGEGFNDPRPANVKPFVQAFEGRVKGIPEWAIGTGLYFEPSAAIG